MMKYCYNGNQVWLIIAPLTHCPQIDGSNAELVIFELIIKINIFRISCKIALEWMPEDLTYD